MNSFLLKILMFFLILVIAISGIFGIVFMLSYNNVSNVKLDEDIHTLICGDSHTKTALNDSIIPNALNIAHSSEHYLYTYNVLKLLLKNHTQVTTVILGLSYHNLSSFYDDYIFDEDKSQYMYPRYFTVLDSKSMLLMLSKNTEGFLANFKDIYHGVYRHINAKELNDYSFIGWFYNSNRNNKNDSTINKAIQEHYYQKDHSVQSFSVLQLTYLDVIVELCCSEDVRLVLINCPLSEEYKAMVPSKFIRNYDEFMDAKEYPLYDFHDFKVPEESYGDGDHLNRSGSEIFSKYLITDTDIISFNAL